MLANVSQKITTVPVAAQIRLLYTTVVSQIDQRWRAQKGLPLNPNVEVGLLNKPDYSFLDGRPTPYGSRQKQRILKNRNFAEQIIQLSREVDFALERHENLGKEEEQRKKNIISQKLKHKGKPLLQKVET